MKDVVAVQVSEVTGYVHQLVQQFERIIQLVTSGQAITLELSEGDRNVVLTIDRSGEAHAESGADSGTKRKARSLSDNENLSAMVSNRFCYDLAEIDRKVTPEDIDALLRKKSGQHPQSSAPQQPDAARVNLPTPAISYVGGSWVLAEDCVYATNDGPVITAKRGFKTDLASIPRFLWFLLAPFELTLAGPIFHDLIYRLAGSIAPPDGEVVPSEKVFTKDEADDIFLELMTREKISYGIRNAAYIAVRLFGKSSWRTVER